MSENGRWTYRAGSRPEGVILYDAGPNGGSLKAHSHHDTDPARGQHNAFDLTRLHLYGALDTDLTVPMNERPSYKAMITLAREQPELRAAQAEHEFEDLGELVTEEVEVVEDERFRVRTADEFASGAPMEWIIRGVLPRAELAIIYGDSGAGKSFLALDICAAITRGVAWRERPTAAGRCVYVCAEGAGGFRTRLQAYAKDKGVDLKELPQIISDAPNMLNVNDVKAILAQIKKFYGSGDAK